MNEYRQPCLVSLRKTLTATWESPANSPELLVDSLTVCLLQPARLKLIVCWAFLVTLSVAWCYVSPFLNLPVSSKRKLFHFTISAVYVTGILWDFQFLCVAAIFVLSVFLTSEAVRLYGPAVFRRILNGAFTSLLDAKDQGRFIFSHLFLLLGMSLPIWIDYLTSETGHHSAVSYAGVITVGVGDSFAAIVGRAIGRHRWPHRNRTLEGSLAMLVSQMKTLEILTLWDPTAFGLLENRSNIWPLRAGWLIHSIITTLIEAYVEGSDNVMVPIFSMVVLYIANGQNLNLFNGFLFSTTARAEI